MRTEDLNIYEPPTMSVELLEPVAGFAGSPGSVTGDEIEAVDYSTYQW